MVSPLWAAPGDITTIPAPMLGSDPPKARSISTGDASVSTQTGALTYAYPITVPPGRHGMQPSLALTYSSHGKIYGGVASGWSLDVPEIRLDTSESFLAQRYVGGLVGAPYHPRTRQRFISTLSGGRPLVPVAEVPTAEAAVEQTYRAQNDAGYTRYERMVDGHPFAWRARTPDGLVHIFGDATLAPGMDWVSPLTRSIDAYGNTIEYEWNNHELQEIRYTSNPGLGLPPFAKVVFEYQSESCPNAPLPIGARLDRRLGARDGYHKLTQIRAHALGVGGTPVYTRAYTLGYDAPAARCDQLHGPQRVLTSIQESASGADVASVTLPAVTFEYNRLARALDRTDSQSEPWGSLAIEDHSLSWGKRLEGAWPTVEAMMLDFDGDGLQDRIESYVDPTAVNECKFVWRRNLGRTGRGGALVFDGPSAPQTMPRLPWAAGATKGPTEVCALNYQRTHLVTPGVNDECQDPGPTYLAYRWLDMNSDGLVDLVAAIHRDSHFDPNLLTNPATGATYFPTLFTGLRVSGWPACTSELPSGGACPQLESSCMATTMVCPAGKPCESQEAALEACVDAAAPVSCGAMERASDWRCSWDPECPRFDSLAPPDLPGEGESCTFMRAHERCDHFPWMIHENEGGELEASGEVKLQQAPLESSNGDSPAGGGGAVFSRTHAVTDIDGDGHLDLVLEGADYEPPYDHPMWWLVFTGDGTGGFSGFLGGHPYVWMVPPSAPVTGACSNAAGIPCEPGAFPGNHHDIRGFSSLLDLDGDGATDYAWSLGEASRSVYGFFSDGRQFLHYSTSLPAIGDWLGGPLTYVSRAFGDTVTPAADGTMLEGSRSSMTRAIDLDADGRVDFAHAGVSGFAADPRPQIVFMNAGGWYPGPINAPSSLRDMLVQRSVAADNPRTWATTRDLIDLDGDGLLEHWNFDAASGGAVPVTRDWEEGPLRLLKKVHNGRGGTVEVAYAPTTDASVVTQAPADRKAMPNVQWVVSDLTVSDAWVTTKSTTAYTYKHPAWRKDDRGRWDFRGFEEVTTTLPSGARTVETYGFDVDWSGRLTETRSFASIAEETAGPRTVSKTVWDDFSLFGGAITTYHPTETRTWTCSNGHTEAQCTAPSTPRAVQRSVWVGLPSAAPEVYVEQQTFLQDGDTYGAGDRRTFDVWHLLSDATRYQLRKVIHAALQSTDGIASNDLWTDYRTWQYDADYRHVLFDTQYLKRDSAGLPEYASSATTTYGYEPTGVLAWKKTPRHHATNDKQLLGYDATHRYVTSTTNELGHVVIATFEPGTGAQLSQTGPNAGQTTWTDVDGVGRPVATYVDHAGVKTKVSRTTYTDAIVAGARTRVRVESLIDYAPAAERWTDEVTELDGRGRPFRIEVVTGATTPLAVTTYHYDHRGHVVLATLPDPSANTSATVTYTYTFDSLGRATSMRRPIVAGTVASGVDTTYDGRVHQYDEIAGSQAGPVARNVLVHDVHGRMTEVREYTDVGAGTYAPTTYAYDAKDRVKRIENADGVVTTLEHDLGGRRVAITRAGRTWTYGYDVNGNMTSEAVPPPNPTLALEYTSTYAYDKTDRVLSRAVGLRGKTSSDPDVDLLGLGTTSFTYDTCTSGVGKLCTVALPSGVLTTQYQYDPESNRTHESRTFDFAGATGTRTTSATYGPDGRVVTQTYADNAVGETTRTVAEYAYDDRAKPSTLTWRVACGTPPCPARVVAAQTRNVAGLVTSRVDDLDGLGLSGWSDFSSTWTYDALTRVTAQAVVQGPTGSVTLLARQKLSYFGLDDPKRLEHFLDGAAFHDFSFAYDPRHQLTNVLEANGLLDATYGFSVGGKLASADVQAASQSGGNVVPRDVTYAYASGVDPEAPSALVPTAGGANLRSYTYDTAGNLATRHIGATSVPATDTFLYDGEDQLRRATSTGATPGTEEYFYDHEGQRTAVVTRNASGTVTGVRVFIGDTELALTPGGALTTGYAHLSLGTPVARIVSPTGGWAPSSSTTGPASLELQYHGLSSNTLVSLNPDGTIVAGFVYAPYGEHLATTGAATSDQRRRFNDKFRDDVTTLHYYGVRYYDDLSLTWTQADPLYRFSPDFAWDEPRRGNLYTFVLGNPVRYVDPDGRNPPGAACIAGAVVGGGPAGCVAAGVAVTAVIGLAAYLGSTSVNDGPNPLPGSSTTSLTDMVQSVSRRPMTTSPPKDTTAGDTPASDTPASTAAPTDTAVPTAGTPEPPDNCNKPDNVVSSVADSPVLQKVPYGRQIGDTMSESANLDTAIEQHEGLREKQAHARRRGKPPRGSNPLDNDPRAKDHTINDDTKSKHNVRNRLKAITCLEDTKNDDID